MERQHAGEKGGKTALSRSFAEGAALCTSKNVRKLGIALIL